MEWGRGVAVTPAMSHRCQSFHGCPREEGGDEAASGAAMASYTVPGQCFICQESLAEGEVTVVRTRGVARLLESSIKWRKSADEQLLGGMASAHLGYDAPSTTPKPTRTRMPQFDFNNKCFLCEKEITQAFKEKQAKLPIARRNNVVKVTLQLSTPKGCIICLNNTSHKVLYDNLYLNEKKGDPQEERFRVVKTGYSLKIFQYYRLPSNRYFFR
ncbi:hypothetical protein PR048_009779 [Dryococelus australis]|uniref:Uncharacterized protein n=1 Tax=Dryococelus australis TaxID=614101 RepID=A0ABQ9I1M5_9NEOP|nr:hypothetical protein PR048_009779 [Dryococelus australis]